MKHYFCIAHKIAIYSVNQSKRFNAKIIRTFAFNIYKNLSKANIIKTDIYIPDEYMNHFSIDSFLVCKITCKRNNCFLNKPKTQHV